MRLAFSFVCSLFLALAALLSDLNEPFLGEYRVDINIAGTVRLLQESLKSAVADRRRLLEATATAQSRLPTAEVPNPPTGAAWWSLDRFGGVRGLVKRLLRAPDSTAARAVPPSSAASGEGKSATAGRESTSAKHADVQGPGGTESE